MDICEISSFGRVGLAVMLQVLSRKINNYDCLIGRKERKQAMISLQGMAEF